MDLITPKNAIEAIRHAVQDHGDEGTTIGPPGDAEQARWIGQILGMTMPPSYLQILAKHNGVCIDEAVYPLMESMETFALHRKTWGEPRLFWPVGGDGCGNYYVLVNSNKDPDGESPVAFLESISKTGLDDPAYWLASTYAHFVYFLMLRQCARQGCDSRVHFPQEQAWPFDPDFVLSFDPGLARLQPRDRWPR